MAAVSYASIRRLAAFSIGRQGLWRGHGSCTVASSIMTPRMQYSDHQKRSLVTKAADLDTPLNSTEEKIKNRLNRNIIQRFFDWMNSDIERDKYVMSETEKNERDELLRRVQEMYFAKPPITPQLDFYKEVFETLIKYDDRLGVQTVWRLMSEMNIKPDDEVEALVQPFLEKTSKSVWF